MFVAYIIPIVFTFFTIQIDIRIYEPVLELNTQLWSVISQQLYDPFIL